MYSDPSSVLTVSEAWGVFQVFLRLVALCTVAPVFGSREIPAPARIGLALLLALVVHPVVAQTLAPMPDGLFPLVAVVFRETLIGLALGTLVSLLFSAATVAGDLMDVQMGFGMAAIFNPALGAQTAMMGQFLYRYTLVVFLLLNGHHLLLDGVVSSFTALPGDRFAPLGDPTAGLRLVGDLATTILASGLRIAAPAVATLLIVDVALALVSRAAPQVNVFLLGMPIKVVVGLLVFVAALGLTTTVLQNYSADAPRASLTGLSRAFGN